MYRFQGKLPPKEGQRRSTLALLEATDGQPKVATLRIYDPIDSWGGDWGVSAKEVAQALDEIGPVDEIHLHLNSPGGEVFEGIAIVNTLRNHPAKIVSIVDGIAASAASFIACASDELVMGQNSQLMIHDAWGVCVGNAGDMTAMAEVLGKLSDNIASIYAAKSGENVAAWRAAMQTESWYTAEEAVTAGLADRVDAAITEPDEKPQNTFDLSVFAYAGREKAPAPVPVDTLDVQDEPPADSTSDAAALAAEAARVAAEDAETTQAMAALTENAARLNAFA